MFRKRSITFLLILSIISSAFYLPVSAPRAQAQFGIPEYGWDLEDITWDIMKKIAIGIAQKMVADMVRSTIDWAQTGFEGNPAYVTDPKQYFTRLADGAAGDFIGGTELGFLCSPFQTQVRIALQRQYSQPAQFQCSLTGVVGNINAFYSDFSQGGWDGWFSMTQNNANNPYGAFIDAQVELDRRIASAVGIEKEQLDWSQGFRGWSDCLIPDPMTGECLQRDPNIKTPGSIIKGQLDKVLSSGFEQTINAKQINELVGAFATGLLTRYVFGDKGLFSKSTGGSQRDIIDIDNDGVPDGWDNDRDGQLDICHHGLRQNLPPRSTPNNANCLGSTEVHNSPYFIPICEALAGAIQELEKYLDFINRNTFAKVYSNTWTNRTVTANGAVENLESAVGRYEIMAYDPALFTLGKYIKFMDDRIESLVDDNFIDQSEVDLLRRNTINILTYLNAFKVSIGQCDAPNTGAIGNIPPPLIEEYVPGTGTPPPINTIPPTIVASIDLGVGTFPDPVYHNGKIYIAVQQGPALSSQLNLYSFDPDLSNQQVQQIPFSGVGLAFQRIVVNNGILWVIFRDGENSVGAIPESIRLWRADTGAVENLGNVVGSGNDPVAIGNGYIAWQNQVGGVITIFRRSITGGTITNLGAGAPTGLSRIMPGGSVVLIDTDRNMFPWGTRFWLAGSLAVAEDFTPPPDNGIVGRFNNDPVTEFNLWPAQVAHTPHAATDGFGNYVIATWNPTVRVAVVK